jgi:RNA polymerase sigma-70 factor, ECF subfamily
MAESVGIALLVVLQKLTPAERLAFVLHDMFAVPFDEIATIVGRSEDAARQLASRARRRVQGASENVEADLSRQREVVNAFLTAVRNGDFEALITVLDPDLVIRGGGAAVPEGAPALVRGVEAGARAALAFAHAAALSQPAIINGSAGIVFAPQGRLRRVLSFTIVQGKIIEIEVIADPDRLRQLDLAVLDVLR